MTRDQAPIDTHSEDRLLLHCGRAELELSLNGGCITAFRWRQDGGWIDWMRPAPAGEDFPPTDSACFPLVPYSNRIRDGRFTFEGRHYQLTANFPPESHSIHGHGWQGRWQAEASDDTSATLVFDFPRPGATDDWPAAYRAEQRFTLSESALTIEIAVTNQGERNMPVGLGLHPYFLRTPACRLIAETGRLWESDATMMPTRLVAPPENKDPSKGVEPSKVNLDSCYTDFRGKAEITWPEWQARLSIESDNCLGFLVVFTPPGEDFFCVEPVSAMTDAVNRVNQGVEDSGFRSLHPGERFAATTVYRPQLA